MRGGRHTRPHHENNRHTLCLCACTRRFLPHEEAPLMSTDRTKSRRAMKADAAGYDQRGLRLWSLAPCQTQARQRHTAQPLSQQVCGVGEHHRASTSNFRLRTTCLRRLGRPKQRPPKGGHFADEHARGREAAPSRGMEMTQVAVPIVSHQLFLAGAARKASSCPTQELGGRDHVPCRSAIRLCSTLIEAREDILTSSQMHTSLI